MRTYLLPLLLLTWWGSPLAAQPNCEAYKAQGDLTKYAACQQSEKTRFYYQFSKEYQEILDTALAIDPTFAHAYRAKSTAYLKSGDFVTWKELIDNAVTYDTLDNIGYRGWCRFQFFRDYQGAIADIEYLESTIPGIIGFSANGDYNLRFVKGLCYRGLGDVDAAISVMKNCLARPKYYVEKYDYLHLGAAYLDRGDYDLAEKYLNLQLENYDIAECRYYLAFLAKQKRDEEQFNVHKEKALALHKTGYKIADPYVEYLDQVGIGTIEALRY
ncbi:tetratricopeptide repeat protein [Neolewinella antarctica]|uniref:Tetratricopeptide (TPR) repeat protein n=1 Tax=Neolewinella antarctica TaxID=442734 RepID=A0ABX0XDK4_9BACT|nr:hypothetical protein [Neolewinella antarctica]NJC26989.1 tetratricopeptide (TPR) repeat protein [Neolewinella antarctica]